MRRNIDPFFKQGLNIPQEPPTGSWEFIQQNINKKEKKKIYPFWLKISGIAALLVLLTAGGYLIENEFNSNNNNQKIVKSSENQVNISAEISSESDLNENPALAQPSLEPKNNEENSERNAYAGFAILSAKNANGNSLVNSSMNEFESNENHSEFQQEIYANENQPEVAWEMPKLNLSAVGNLKFEDLIQEKTEGKILITSNKNSNQKEKSKEFKKKKVDFDRFYVAGFASPMAFNTFVGNSMLSDEMSQYKTENSITLAYGIKAGYAISPRVKLRTGISVIGFEQITKDVPLASNIQGSAYSPSVDQVNNVTYQGSLRIDNSPVASLANYELINKAGNGNIQQQSSYLEIPVEAEVALFQTSSIGISATAGGSTWVLSKNKIYAHTEDYTEELGRANNLNNVSFSANAGLKFDLNLSDNVKLNLEPNFKYLVNPVNDIKSYNPYTVGVNAGISVSLK